MNWPQPNRRRRDVILDLAALWASAMLIGSAIGWAAAVRFSTQRCAELLHEALR